MDTLFVPTDFSPVARNAVHYAIDLARQLKSKKLILYHAYEIPVAADPITPMMQMIDIDELKRNCEAGMRHFSTVQLRDFDLGDLQVETVCEMASLPGAIVEAAARMNADLIVMGITGESGIVGALFGSNSISVAKQAPVPVLIIPAEARFTGLKKVMFACDLKKVIDTTPVGPIRRIVSETNASLHVLHVDAQNEKFSTGKEQEIRMLNGLLGGLQPEYAFVDSNDFMQAINEYVTGNAIDLIISIPKKHGLFEGLFHRSHVKMLAFHSHVPLLIIHE